MADTDFDTLLDRLAERTAAGTVNWKMTSRDDEFVIYFQKFALTMRHGFDEDGDEYVTFRFGTKRERRSTNIGSSRISIFGTRHSRSGRLVAGVRSASTKPSRV